MFHSESDGAILGASGDGSILGLFTLNPLELHLDKVIVYSFAIFGGPAWCYPCGPWVLFF